MELSYATEFSVDAYGDYRLITIDQKDRFLLIPKGAEIPSGLPDGVVAVQSPPEHIYLVSSSVMDFFRSLDALANVRMSGTKESDWHLEEARAAMEQGTMLYAGKYSAPDYELILGQGCDLAIENTMIYHNPEVKEQLEKLGIPVIVEHSSYESHPLGRLEWIKLYGTLLGKEREAEEIYENWLAALSPVLTRENTGRTVAFFYITKNGAVSVRKSGDYIAKMIELAGGNYIFSHLDAEEENALSTMNIQMEEFYAVAKDADYLIYNSTIDEELHSMKDLLGKSSLLGDFKAVREGHVYCTGKNFFQETTGMGQFIQELHGILSEEQTQTQFLWQLR
ncbi:MAG: ABC transporter substrate-binding protein [Lachnospiraceae bacterium]|nr:ABC transporter substrate-binding protein [Lachnospiraceae bacterium]